MKPAAAALLLLAGCLPTPEAITRRPATRWDSLDCITLIAPEMTHNLHSGDNVVWVATRFTPDVIRAVVRLGQLREGYSDSAAYEETYGLTLAARGLYVDRGGTTWSRVGRQTKPDSLMVLLSLTNRTFPCDPVVVGGVPILLAADVPCILPGIADIVGKVYLTSPRGDTLHPVNQGGRKHDTLTTDENILFVFDVSDADDPDRLTFHFEGLK